MIDSIMNGCLRCPRCHKVPHMPTPEIAIGIPSRITYTLLCEEHSYEAHGDTPQLAVKHWNMFIEYIITQMPFSLRPERQTKEAKLIFDAAHGIDPHE